MKSSIAKIHKSKIQSQMIVKKKLSTKPHTLIPKTENRKQPFKYNTSTSKYDYQKINFTNHTYNQIM